LVLIGLNGPRTSSGASGLGSNVSCCGGPPASQRKITLLAFPNDLSVGRIPGATVGLPHTFPDITCDSDSPSADNPPTRNISRREKPLQSRAGEVRRESID
jgi:hypothetical protein